MRHKWGLPFKKSSYIWQKCVHCGQYRTYIGSTAFYSPSATIHQGSIERPECVPKQ